MLRWPVQIARRPAGFAVIGLMAALAFACPFALAEAARSAKPVGNETQHKTVGNEAQQQLWVEGLRLANAGGVRQGGHATRRGRGPRGCRIRGSRRWTSGCMA